MADTLNLLPCPFCNGAAASLDKKSTHATCVECVFMPWLLIEDWNRRASSPAVPEGALPPLPKRTALTMTTPDSKRVVEVLWEAAQYSSQKEALYTAEQMQAYARAAVEADRAQRPETITLNGRKTTAAEVKQRILDLDAENAALHEQHDKAAAHIAKLEATLADRARQGEPVGDGAVINYGSPVAYMYVEDGETYFGHPDGYRPADAIPLYRDATKAAAPADEAQQIRQAFLDVPKHYGRAPAEDAREQLPSIDNEEFRALLGAYSESLVRGYVHTEADEERFIAARRALVKFIDDFRRAAGSDTGNPTSGEDV